MYQFVEHVEDGQSKPSSPSVKATSVQNPFVFFQEYASDACSGEVSDVDADLDDEPATLVFQHLVYGESIVYGQQRFSDGTSTLACGYKKETDGFIVCVFADGSELTTSIPNEYVHPSGEFICRPIVPSIPLTKPKAKAKPKKKAEDEEFEESGEEDEDDKHEEHDKEPEVKTEEKESGRG